jgi:hypothetical protein
MIPKDNKTELSNLLKSLEILKQELIRLRDFEQKKLEGLRNVNLGPDHTSLQGHDSTGH